MRVSDVVNPSEPSLGLQSSPSGRVSVGGGTGSVRSPGTDSTSTVFVPQIFTVIEFAVQVAWMATPVCSGW